MKMLCASFITSLLSPSVSKTQSTDDRIERDETMQNDEESEESEEELSRPENRESPPVAEIDNVDETKVQLVDHNWTFLRTILPDREEIEQQLIDDNLEPTLPSENIYNLV